MVGGRKISSESQGPEDLQNWSQPQQLSSLGIGLIAARQPVSHASERERCSAKRRRNAWQRASKL